MAKSLQEQLLAAGLADKKKAKQAAKARKKQDHLQRTGQSNDIDQQRETAKANRKQKAETDKQLNIERQKQAEAKAIAAQIKQLIDTNKINLEDAEIKYQFLDGKKVKQLFVTQPVYDRLSRGQLAIIATDKASYAVIPLTIAEKISQRDDQRSIIIAVSEEPTLDEDDPYAAYQIPDDLMW